MSEMQKKHPILKALLILAAIAAGVIAVILAMPSTDDARFYNDPDLTKAEIDAGFRAAAARLPSPGGDSMDVAKGLCRWFDETGAGFWQGVDQLASEYPEFTSRAQVVEFADAATSAYCPQHSRT